MTLAELKTGDMTEILGHPMMNAHYRAPGWLIAIVANGAGTAMFGGFGAYGRRHRVDMI